MSDELEELPDGSEMVTCWCGVTGAMEDMFDDAVYGQGCGGSGVLYCECGGDSLCVCHNHGEVECPGCEDCELDDDDYDDGPFYDD